MAGRALIVVDVQEGFTRMGNLASPVCTEALPRIVSIVESAFSEDVPVIFTKDSHVPDDLEFRMFPPHCVVGTAEHELAPELRPFEERAAAVIQKTRYSAFFGTSLDELLKRLDVEEVHVAGVCTDICVLHTTADLRNRDYPVTVLAEGVQTFDAPGHDHDDVNAWAFAHMETILGATVEGAGTGNGA